jgi:hypothetical protein
MMLKAEDNTVCIKDAALWSPILAQSNLKIQFWNITIKGLRQHTNVTKRLKSIMDKMNADTKTSIQNTTCSATRALRKAIKHHNKLANDLNERDDTPGRIQVEDLIKREQKRQDFSIIRNVLKQKKSKGFTMIEVPSVSNPGGWDLISKPEQIIDNLIHRNIIHFGQAKDTPFANTPLAEIFGYKGTNNTINNLIKNQDKPTTLENHSLYVQKIIDKLGDGNKLPSISDKISFEEFISGIKKWKETTTTSPSGRHLGHYKILHNLNVIDDSNTNIGNRILQLYYDMIQIVSKFVRN